MGQVNGFVKVIVDEESGMILGAHLFCPRATGIIGELVVAIKNGLMYDQLGDTVHPHPTVCESVMEAVEDLQCLCIHLLPRK
jgi:dihydrolipoamide dehydrogenase